MRAAGRTRFVSGNLHGTSAVCASSRVLPVASGSDDAHTGRLRLVFNRVIFPKAEWTVIAGILVGKLAATRNSNALRRVARNAGCSVVGVLEVIRRVASGFIDDAADWHGRVEKKQAAGYYENSEEKKRDRKNFVQAALQTRLFENAEQHENHTDRENSFYKHFDTNLFISTSRLLFCCF
jgi:hypothetical protein